MALLARDGGHTQNRGVRAAHLPGAVESHTPWPARNREGPSADGASLQPRLAAVWRLEQLLERAVDHEVHEVQAEAEKLQKGWGQGDFGQAYSMLRRERQEEKQHEQMRKDAAVLTIEFTKLSGGVVTFVADGRYLGDRTQMLLRKEAAGAPKEVAYKTDVKAELVIGVGEEQKTYSCEIPEMELDKDSDKPQWKQLGHDSAAALR